MCGAKKETRQKKKNNKTIGETGASSSASLALGTVILSTSNNEQRTILPSEIASITVPVGGDSGGEGGGNGQLTIIEKYPLFRARTALIVRYVELYSNQVRANPKHMTPKESVGLAQRTWPKIAEQVNKAFPQLKALNSNQAMTIYSIFIQAKTKLEAERKNKNSQNADGEPKIENELGTDVEEIKLEPVE